MKNEKCKHDELGEFTNFCDDCGNFVYYVYCPKCGKESIDVVDSPCKICGTKLKPDQREEGCP